MNAFGAFLKRRWPAVLLVASLVLNGFLVGMVAADSLKPRGGWFSGERLTRFELRRFDERLSKDAVETIAAQLRPLAPQLDERIERLRAIREEIMRLAAAPEPDRAAIEERLAALRDEGAAMQEAVQQSTYDALLALPAAERARLADNPG
ncbi:MAG: periplasmic heavy metal sensor [Propylenella sp.]